MIKHIQVIGRLGSSQSCSMTHFTSFIFASTAASAVTALSVAASTAPRDFTPVTLVT